MRCTRTRVFPTSCWNGTDTTISIRQLSIPTTAWLYGCSGVNTSLFGIGERTGNTPLEAMVFEYAQLRGTLNGMDTRVITELAEYYEKEIGYHIPPRTPFVGKELQCHKSGYPCRRSAEKRRDLQHF